MQKTLFGNNLVRNTTDGIIIDEIPLKKLLKEIQTPFYIILQEKIRRNLKILQDMVEEVFDFPHIAYSVKANYMDVVLKEVNNNGFHFELISQFEYDLLRKLKLNTENLVVGGPHLPNSLIQDVLSEENPLFVLYTFDQLHRVNSIAMEKNQQVKAILRFIAPKSNGHLGFIPNEQNYTQLRDELSKLDHISIHGIHSHYGTQINSFSTYRKNIQYILQITKKLEKMGLLNAEIFDIGGGLPNAGAVKPNQLISVLHMIKDEIENSGYTHPRVYLEPGRYVVEDAGLFVMKIINVAKDGNSFFVNAGNHVLPRFARNSLRFYNVSQELSHYNHKTTIYGIVPSEEDVLINNYNFSPINKIGDYIIVLNCGAYAHTFSNRFPYYFPSTVSIDGSSYKINK
jgi:diaminopimelate decarboxylase